MSSTRRVVLLGPQRMSPTLLETARSLGLDEGPFATVTAGWEEREGIDRELAEHLGAAPEDGRVRNLQLYQRAETIYARDPAFGQAVRDRHDRLRACQELYRLRLRHAAEATRELLHREPRPGEDDLLEAEQTEAIEAMRTLDAGHLERVRSIHAEFDARWRPAERDDVAAQRRELEAILSDVRCVCIAGGHVAVLLERLRLFSLADLLGERTIIAWSAGAMALSERIVLFHDHPPQGPGNAEVFDAGLGFVRDLVPLPHSKRRLRLGDPVRVRLLARRFGPALCLALDEEDRADWDGKAWTVATGSRRLTAAGAVEELSVA